MRIANDTIYGLHGAVFTTDVDRAREVAGQMRTGTIGHNGFKYRLRAWASAGSSSPASAARAAN